jgi:DNA-binding transcriptional ArsR family regulator
MPPEPGPSPALEPRIAKALAHPLRFRVLWRLNEVEASPKELADELGESLPKVAYHVNVLHDVGAIELVRETPRRGAIEHHYRAVTRAVLSDRDWAALPDGIRAQISGSVLERIVDELRTAVESGTLDARPDRHLSFTTLELDEAGWRELGKLLADVVERAVELSGKADGAGGSSIPARLSLMLYEGPPTPAPEAS